MLKVDRCPSDLAGCWVAEVPREPPPVVLSFCRHPSLAVAVLRLHQVLELLEVEHNLLGALSLLASLEVSCVSRFDVAWLADLNA